MKKNLEQPVYTEERLQSIKRFEVGLKGLIVSLYKENLSIAIKEGKARAKKLREEMANGQETEKE